MVEFARIFVRVTLAFFIFLDATVVYRVLFVPPDLFPEGPYEWRSVAVVAVCLIAIQILLVWADRRLGRLLGARIRDHHGDSGQAPTMKTAAATDGRADAT